MQQIVTYICVEHVWVHYSTYVKYVCLNDTCDNLSTYIIIYVTENIVKCFDIKNILNLAICLAGGGPGGASLCCSCDCTYAIAMKRYNNLLHSLNRECVQIQTKLIAILHWYYPSSYLTNDRIITQRASCA